MDPLRALGLSSMCTGYPLSTFSGPDLFKTVLRQTVLEGIYRIAAGPTTTGVMSLSLSCQSAGTVSQCRVN